MDQFMGEKNCIVIKLASSKYFSLYTFIYQVNTN